MVQSALVGEPPLTTDDYWIVKGSFLAAGLTSADPNKGLHIPPRRPPPDEYHFQTRGPAVIAVCSVAMAVMIFVTVARLMVRKLRKDLKFGLDDWLIMPAMVLSILWPILQICMVKLGGGGKHLYDVTYYNLAMNNWFGTFSKVTFFVALGFIKLSIVSFNMRLTGLSSRKWMYAHWTFFGILVLFILTSIFLVTFQCNPVVAGWDSIATGKLDNPPKCLSELATSNPLSIWHVTMDFCLLAVPVLVLWKIQVPRSTKARLIALFSVGAVCCFGSVMRQLSQAKLKTDPTYNYTALVYWSVVDLAMSLIVASLPVLGSVIPVFGLFSRKPTKPSGASSSYVMSKPKSSHIPRDLHGKESREGIMRQDEVELEYHTHDSLALEEGSEHRGTISKDAYGVEQRTMPWAASNRIERG